MPDFWKRLGVPLLVASLILIATALMLSDRPSWRREGRELPWWQGVLLDVAVPLQKLVGSPLGAANRLWVGYVDLLGVREDNERLRARVAELQDENLQFREALVTSAQLQQIAAMRKEFDVPMLPAGVVGVDVSSWFRSVLIDRGRRQGVRGGQPVLTNDGVAGLVTAVSQDAAKAVLLLDRQSAVDGLVQRSRVRGIVRGRGTDSLEFEFTSREGDVDVGDVILTSGLDGVYPKGLRIGHVVAVSDPGGRLMQTATVQPAVDYGRLERAFVVLRRGPAMELLYREVEPLEIPPPATLADPSAQPVP